MTPRAQLLVAGSVIGVLLVVLVVSIVLEGTVREWAIDQAQGPAPPSLGPQPPLLEPGELARIIDERLRATPGASPRPFSTSLGTLALWVEGAGEVRLPTGRVVVSDAFFVGLTGPLATAIDTGSAPITLLMTSFGDGAPTNAAAVLGPTDGLGELRWEPGFAEGEDPAAAGRDELAAYPVDSGTAAFTSAEAAATLAADETFTDRMLAALEESGYTEPAVLGLEDGQSVVAFASGVGDGAYPVWIGARLDGQAVAVLTDFAILDHPLAMSAPRGSEPP